MRKDKFNQNLLKQYSYFTLIITIVMLVVLSLYVYNYTKNSIIKSHIELYPSVLSVIMRNNDDYFEHLLNENAFNGTEEYFNDFYDIGYVFRIKLFSKHGIILWSDAEEIIGKNFSDNINYKNAIKGEIVYEVEKPTTSENKSESDYNEILEIYVPIYENKEVVGVVELYEDYTLIRSDIDKARNSILLIVFISGTILYISQFYIFYAIHLKLKKTHERLEKVEDVTIFSLASLAETRDNETGLHLKRTAKYVELICNKLVSTNMYCDILTKEYIEDMVRSAPLHDIGKVGIRDSILLKKGKLTFEEFNEMKEHCIIGTNTLEIADAELEFESFLTIAKYITNYHHEKWDGSGYPEGLSKDEIPLPARIMALADVYDALTSKRPYKDAMSHEVAKAIIIEENAKHFDPDIIKVFLDSELEFEYVRKTLLPDVE